MERQEKIEQLNIPAILFLHLFPGLVILLVSIWFANPHWGIGLPIFLSLLLAILFGLIPVELGILYYIARKQGEKIGDIFGFSAKMQVGKTFLWALPCFVIAVISFVCVY